MGELPLNLLLLPLLGGFVFVSRWNPSRFFILRSEGYRFLFHSALAGLSLLFLSAVLVHAFLTVPDPIGGIITSIDHNWHSIAPAYSGIAVLALLMGCLLWVPLNYLSRPKSFQIDDVISRKGDALEIFLRRAMGSAAAVRIQLKTGDRYVGYVTSNYNPIFQTEYIRLLPVCYRQNNTNYYPAKAFANIVLGQDFNLSQGSDEKPHRELEDRLRLRDFEIVLPVTEILSVVICTYPLSEESQNGTEAN